MTYTHTDLQVLEVEIFFHCVLIAAVSRRAQNGESHPEYVVGSHVVGEGSLSVSLPGLTQGKESSWRTVWTVQEWLPTLSAWAAAASAAQRRCTRCRLAPSLPAARMESVPRLPRAGEDSPELRQGELLQLARAAGQPQIGWVRFLLLQRRRGRGGRRALPLQRWGGVQAGLHGASR